MPQLFDRIPDRLFSPLASAIGFDAINSTPLADFEPITISPGEPLCVEVRARRIRR